MPTLGFVRNNPWVRLDKDPNAHGRPINAQLIMSYQPMGDELAEGHKVVAKPVRPLLSPLESLKYGPGIVERLRQRYQQLSSTDSEDSPPPPRQAIVPSRAYMSTDDLTASAPDPRALHKKCRDSSVDREVVKPASILADTSSLSRQRATSMFTLVDPPPSTHKREEEPEFLATFRRLRHIPKTHLLGEYATAEREYASPPSDPSPWNSSLTSRQIAVSDASPPPDEPHPPSVPLPPMTDAVLLVASTSSVGGSVSSAMSDSDIDTYDVGDKEQACPQKVDEEIMVPLDTKDIASDLAHMKSMLQHFEDALGGDHDQLLGLSAAKEEVVSISEKFRERQRAGKVLVNGEGAGTETLTFTIDAVDDGVVPCTSSAMPSDELSSDEEECVTVMFGDSAEAHVIKRSTIVKEQLTGTTLESKCRAPSPPCNEEEGESMTMTTTTVVTICVDASDKPLSEHPDRDMLEKMLNLIEEEDIPDFIASIREQCTLTMEGEMGTVVGGGSMGGSTKEGRRGGSVQFNSEQPLAYAYEMEHSDDWTPGVHITFDQYRQMSLNVTTIPSIAPIPPHANNGNAPNTLMNYKPSHLSYEEVEEVGVTNEWQYDKVNPSSIAEEEEGEEECDKPFSRDPNLLF